jgi:hypothetical protein
LAKNKNIVNLNVACWIGSIGPKIISRKGSFQAQANPTIGSQILLFCDILLKLQVKFDETFFCH